MPKAGPQPIDSAILAEWLTDGDELALLDAREQGVFLEAHLFHAACIPLSQLELLLPSLVPRLDTRLVWCDDGSAGLADRAARRASELGWSNCSVLEGGTAGWASNGGELYAGVNVPSKAFGEYVEHTYGTPRMPAAEVKALLDDGADMVILDSRPIQEFRNMSIPTGTDCPGAELVHRVKELVDDPDTLVVVNCAGRTRSIIGSQSLINAGLENRVVALENGTMGWELAGFHVDRGREVHAPDPSPASRAWAEAAAARVATRFGVERIDHELLKRWRADPARTTYLLDVRTPDEYDAGHLAGSTNAPGGQLVQATDEYVATRNARLVLVDDTGVRATMTASWLRQMGWLDVVVLDAGLDGQPLETGTPSRRPVGSAPTIKVSGARRSIGRRRRFRGTGRDRHRYQPEVSQQGSHPRCVVGCPQPPRRGPHGDRRGRYGRAHLDRRTAGEARRDRGSGPLAGHRGAGAGRGNQGLAPRWDTTWSPGSHVPPLEPTTSGTSRTTTTTRWSPSTCRTT